MKLPYYNGKQVLLFIQYSTCHWSPPCGHKEEHVDTCIWWGDIYRYTYRYTYVYIQTDTYSFNILVCYFEFYTYYVQLNTKESYLLFYTYYVQLHTKTWMILRVGHDDFHHGDHTFSHGLSLEIHDSWSWKQDQPFYHLYL